MTRMRTCTSSATGSTTPTARCWTRSRTSAPTACAASSRWPTACALFPAYLVPAAPGYVRRSRPTVAQAIDVIHAAGGLAVWAHPYWDVADPIPTLLEFAGMGIDGVEAFYTTFTAEQTVALYRAARERGLLTTGSTDFHGPAHEHFNRFRGFELHGLEPDLGRLVQ
jgi:hypothetical protein